MGPPSISLFKQEAVITHSSAVAHCHHHGDQRVSTNEKEGLIIPIRSSRRGSAEMNLTSIQEDAGLIPGLAQWVKDLVLPWQWHRSAAAVPVRPLAQELTYATSVAIKKEFKKGWAPRCPGSRLIFLGF